MMAQSETAEALAEKSDHEAERRRADLEARIADAGQELKKVLEGAKDAFNTSLKDKPAATVAAVAIAAFALGAVWRK